MAKVVLNNIVKKFGSVTAVNNLSIEIQDKEFAVLVGSSGCGKTTALRMIAGLETASSGEIHIGETRVNDMPPRDRDIAMVFQNYALYPHMNIRENMGFGLKVRKFSDVEINKRVDEAADILGLKDYLNRKPKELSGGQRQRVAVGRAIVRKPKVFLFDEPLSNLDAKLRVAMRAEISKLHRRLEATIIYVTHDQVEAMTMADKIYIMSQGILQQSGTPMQVYAHPANCFVAGFIGSPAMNFIDVKVAGEGENLRIEGADGFIVKVPEAFREKVSAYAGKEVIFGVRPEDMSLHDPANTNEDYTVSAQADVIELLGSEIFVHMTCAKAPCVARMEVPTQQLQVGQTLKIDIKMLKTHVFDKSTSLVIV